MALIFTAIYLTLTLLFATQVPLLEAPDEPGHFDQILYLVENQSLPVQSIENRNYAHHPPLYYLVSALPVALVDWSDVSSLPKLRPDFKWPSFDQPAVATHYTAETFPYSGQVLGYHLARLVSIASGLVTLLLLMAIGRMIFPRQPELTWLASGLVVFNPQFLFVNSTVTNDSLLITTCTGVIYQLISVYKKPDYLWGWVWLGIWCALAILTKSIAIVVLSIAGFFACFIAIQKRSLPFFIRIGLASGLPILLLGGWWFIRNQVLYGDIFGWQVYQQAWAVNLRSYPLRLADIPSILETQYLSFWGVFGWMNVYAPYHFYLSITALLIIAIVGWGIGLMSGKLRLLTADQKIALAMFSSYFVLLEAFVLYQNSVHNSTLSQGRFLLPAAVPLAFLSAYGLLNVLPKSYKRLAIGGVTLCLMALPIYSLAEVIRPAYPTIPRPKMSVYTLQERTDYLFGDMFALRGYNWSSTKSDQPGISVIDLELHWQAAQPPDFDYSVFVHALNGNDEILSQADHAPGVGQGYLPTGWRVKDIVADQWRLEVPDSQLDAGLRLRVGVYNWATGERLAELNHGDFVILEVD